MFLLFYIQLKKRIKLPGLNDTANKIKNNKMDSILIRLV